MNNPLLKVVVWDLDNTLWQGVAAEGDKVVLRDGVLDLVQTFDSRGVVQSVASRGDERIALAQLDALDMRSWFLYPQVGWGDKSASIERIATELNLRLENFAFIDDDPYERAEVAAALPMIQIYPAAVVATPEVFCLPAEPPGAGAQSSRRRLYQVEEQRKKAEAASGMARQEFLRSLGLRMRVRPAIRADVPRLAELTMRTSQLNTTGLVMSQDDLIAMLDDQGQRVLVAELSDRFGGYGTVGLAAIQILDGSWRIRLLLTSCRVVSRGAGSLLLRVLLREGHRRRIRVECELIETGHNRLMLIALRFAGMRLAGACVDHEGCAVYGAPDDSEPPQLPENVSVTCRFE